MSKDQIDVINEAILNLAEKETILQEDLMINNEKIIDLIFKVDDKETKLNLLSDLVLLDIDFDNDDLLKICKTNDKDLILCALSRNDAQHDESLLKFAKIAMNEDVSSNTYFQVVRPSINVIIDNAANIIKNYVNNVDSIPEKNNDKMYLLLTVFDKKNSMKEEELEDFKKFIPFSMAKKANPKLFKLLLSSKHDMHMVNENNENILFFLNGENKEELKAKHKLLLESGIDVTLVNKSGMSYIEANKNLADMDVKADKKIKHTM